LDQSENEYYQQTLQHSLSFGSQTLPPDRNVVNPSVGNGQWGMVNGLPAEASAQAGQWSIGPDDSPFTIHHCLLRSSIC
jgi:hypothetical protein